MKPMVIRGSQAPKCEEKPRNPTSASLVGTMTGSVAGGKRRGRAKAGADAHQTQYQGLLQAPRLPGMFDQQPGRTSPDSSTAAAEEATGEGMTGSFMRVRGPTGLTESPFTVGPPGADQPKHGKTAGADPGLGSLSKGAGKPPKTSQPQQHRAKTGQRYHYQKFGGQSATSVGGSGQPGGAGPGQKSIKQQRDLAQLRFYQTLTNQPHLISQSHSQGKQTQQMPIPAQVKMLSNMKLAQQPSVGQNRIQQHAQDLQDPLHDNQFQPSHVSGLAAEGRRSLAGDRLPQRLGLLGSGQGISRAGQAARGEVQGLPFSQAPDQAMHYQLRSKTPQRGGSDGEGAPIGNEEALAQAEMVDGTIGRAKTGQSNDLAAAMGGRQPGALQGTSLPGHGGGLAGHAIENDQLVHDLSGKHAQQLALGNNDRMAVAHEGEANGLPQRQPGLGDVGNAEHLQTTEFGTAEDPYGQKRAPQAAMRAEDQYAKPPLQGRKQPQLLSHILNGPVPPATAGRAQLRAILPDERSGLALRQHESVRNSETYTGALRGSQAVNRAGVARRSHSPKARPGVEPSSRSRERDGGRSPSRGRGKNGASHIAKMEKKNQYMTANDKARGGYNVAGTAEEDFARRMERFSSQGQEELVQAYQLPTVYAGNDSRAGFHGYQSQQQPKKRNQTGYGGPRSKAATGIAPRNVEGLRDSINSIYKMVGGGMGTSASGHQLVPVNRQASSVTQPGQPTQVYRQAGSKGALNNILVKACSFQAREGTAEKRDQIRTAYTITRAGRQGMGVLPQIDAKIAEHPEILGVSSAVGGHEQVSSTRDGTMGRGPATAISLGDGQAGKQPHGRDYNQAGKIKQDSEIRAIQDYPVNRRPAGGALAPAAQAKPPCKRFMERGNKPVPSNYEEQEVAAALQRATEHAAAAQANPDEVPPRGNNANTEMGKAASRQSGRQMVYGNLKLGQFDEEISGINLSKLFSVYGPQSAEGRRRKKGRQGYQSGVMSQSKNKDLAKSSLYRGFESYQDQNQKSSQPQASANDQAVQGDPLGQNNMVGKDLGASQPPGAAGANGAPAGLPAQLNAVGSGQRVSPTAAKGISSVGNLLKGEGGDQPGGELGEHQQDEQQRVGGENQEDYDDLSEDDESDDDEEEPLIIQLMESMFTRKKTVQESEQMISEISVDAIRQEIRRLALQEKCRLTSIEREKFFQQRMNDCEKLNELIKRENEDLSESILGRPDLSTRENPFYLALKAQKEERDRYKKLLQLAIMNGVSTGDKDVAERPMALMDGPASHAIEPPMKEDGANDIFKHTFVDVLDDNKAKPSSSDKVASETEQPVVKKRKDIFYFYNLSFDLPTEYYKQLGDFSLVNQIQASKIKEFMLGLWPVLRGKKVQYKIAYDAEKEVFNVVLLGKDCPLSKCCKMTVYFQFTKDIGGKVICMENLCALNPLDHFFIELDLVKTLFYDYPLGLQQADNSDLQGQPNAGTDLMKHLAPPDIMTRAQFKKLKPTFKKVISNEISKMISKGTHMNLSIRDVISNQHLEEKVQHQATKGKPLAARSRGALGVPKRLTQSKLLRLLYDTSSQASSQLSQFGMGDQQAYDGDFGGQPMGSIHWTGNEDMAFVMDNQDQYAQGQMVVGSMPHDLPAGVDGFQWVEAPNGGDQYDEAQINPHRQMYNDGFILAAPPARGSDQTAILFSQSAQHQDPEAMQQQNNGNMIMHAQDEILSDQRQNQANEMPPYPNNAQMGSGGCSPQLKNGAGTPAAATGSLGTSNPGPSLIKPTLSEQPERQVIEPGNSSGSGQAQATGDGQNNAGAQSEQEGLNTTNIADGGKVANGSSAQQEGAQGK